MTPSAELTITGRDGQHVDGVQQMDTQSMHQSAVQNTLCIRNRHLVGQY